MSFEQQIEEVSLHRRRMMRVRLWDRIPGMTEAEYQILDVLIRVGAESVTVSQLQEGTGIHPTAVSRLMNGLEKRELIERRTRRDNRRITDVSVTQAGRREYERARGLLHRYWERVFSHLPPEDVSMMFRLWDEMIDHMEHALDEINQGGVQS